jgi:hypothetical protein
MSRRPDETTRVIADPGDSVLLSLARAVAGGGANGNATWPKLDLSDAKQREFGDYELLDEIGRGGMGVVYRARQLSLDRDVAIKFIADWFADPSAVARFLAEARAAARLMHPNIVPVHEVGSVDGMHYFSMPLIRGRSLASLLDAGTLPPADAIALLLKLCEAIDYAHRLGLLHLDLKPANVLIDAREEPLIADFGLARHMDANGGVDAQEVSGTPAFMAPEQILIKQYRLTPATDIYALGAILYRCLTGVSPHGEGNPDDVIRRAAAGRIRPPCELDPKIPRDLDAICMKCLELQPSDRYASAAQLADDLRRTRDGLPVSVRRVGLVERAQRWLRREPKLAGAIGLAALALLAGAAATTWQWKRAAAERDRATIAGEIGAHLFAYSGENDKRAEDLIRWLRKRLPGAEERQAEALTDFTTSVMGENSGSGEDLLVKVVQVLGGDYRQQMIKTLQAGSDPNRHMYSALIAYADEKDSDTPDQFAAYLKAAIQASPNDPFVWQMAAVFCPGKKEPHCLYPAAAQTLARLDPDNMYPRILLLAQSSDDEKAREWLHEAAQRGRFDDYSLTLFGIYPKMIAVAHVPAPPLIARPVQLLAPAERPELSIANIMKNDFPMASYARLSNLCGNSGKVGDARIRSDCLTVGERMFRSSTNATLLAQMVGVALVRNVDNNTPLAVEAQKKRRLYAYTVAMADKLSESQLLGYPVERLLRDIGSVGELDAWRRRNAYYGIPGEPPDGWKPEDLAILLTAHERSENADALNRNAATLVTQGKYGEAATLLASAEETMRTHFKDDWRLVRYLTILAKARTGEREFIAAQTSLDDAWKIAAGFGPTSRDARDCAHAHVDLYTAWNAAEPGKGHDVKTAEWQSRLAELEAAKDE